MLTVKVLSSTPISWRQGRSPASALLDQCAADGSFTSIVADTMCIVCVCVQFLTSPRARPRSSMLHSFKA